jgi:hypothetical protein
MKKSIIFSMLVGAAMLVACNPIEDRDVMSGAITADQLKISATPVVKDGVKSNYIQLNSEGNACLSSWDYGFGTLAGTKGTVKVMMAGDNEIVYSGMNTDGTIIKKTITVHVDKLYDVEPEWALFCGTTTGKKTWVWAKDNKYSGAHWVWGNGGALADLAPAWWGRSEADASGDNIDINGTMTFDLHGASFTKVESGVTSKGSFSFDMTKKQDPRFTNVIGMLTIKGTTIQHGISQNDGKKVVNTFNIIKLTNDEMILMYATEGGLSGGWPEGWYWVFKRQGYSY